MFDCLLCHCHVHYIPFKIHLGSFNDYPYFTDQETTAEKAWVKQLAREFKLSPIPEHWAAVGVPLFLSFPRDFPGVAEPSGVSPSFAHLNLRTFHRRSFTLPSLFISWAPDLCHALAGYQRHKEDPDMDSSSRRQGVFTRGHMLICLRNKQETYTNEADWMKGNRKWRRLWQ